ncbi:hypothetical protein PZA11_005859 [Diplocarpon coronariae]
MLQGEKKAGDSWEDFQKAEPMDVVPDFAAAEVTDIVSPFAPVIGPAPVVAPAPVARVMALVQCTKIKPDGGRCLKRRPFPHSSWGVRCGMPSHQFLS